MINNIKYFILPQAEWCYIKNVEIDVDEIVLLNTKGHHVGLYNKTTDKINDVEWGFRIVNSYLLLRTFTNLQPILF